jgi:hypothetical protein
MAKKKRKKAPALITGDPSLIYRGRKHHDSVLRTYLAIMRSLFDQTRRKSMKLGEHVELVSSESAASLWAQMKEARIFVVHPEQYGAFYRSADLYTTEVIAGLKWISPEEDFEQHKRYLPEEADILLRATEDAARSIPFPPAEKWPFPTMFIGFGSQLGLSPLQLHTRLSAETVSYANVNYGHLLGILLFQDAHGEPWAIEIIGATHDYEKANDPTEVERVETLVWATAYNPLDGWKHPFDLNPWVINSLMAHLMGFQTFIEESFISPTARWERKKFERQTKVKLPVPKPYYTIKLQSKLIEDRTRKLLPKLGRTYEYNHRWEVRGHERVRFQRGELPIDPKLRRKLVKRGYRVYDIEEPVAEDVARMIRRGLPPKRPGEWLALKVSQVKPYTKGPEGTPLVPSMRVA